MELAFGIEDATNEAVAFKSLLLATIEAAFNSSYGPEEFKEAFNFLYGLAYDHSEHLKRLENESFRLLKSEEAAEQEEVRKG